MYIKSTELLTIVYLFRMLSRLLVFTCLVDTITLVWCCTGIGMHSVTGSRIVVDILNMFGHSVSYRVSEGIPEKDMALLDILFQLPGCVS